MLCEIVPKVKKVIELAKKCNWENVDETPQDLVINDLKDLEDNEQEQELISYLYSLPYDDIETIEAIMYLGRNKEYDAAQTPESILKKEIEYCHDLYGEGDKNMAIEYITSKMPLATYLNDGLSILKQL